MAKMDTATTQAEGGRKAQLLALQGSVTWTDAPVPLSMPLRCFFMPPRHFDVMCESKEPYTESGKPSQAQGSHFPEVRSVLTFLPLMLSDDSAFRAHHLAAFRRLQHQC